MRERERRAGQRERWTTESRRAREPESGKAGKWKSRRAGPLRVKGSQGKTTMC